MKIKNWSHFQHFKDRSPPWIKLHRSILEQRDIASISDRSFRLLIILWLLASEDKEKAGNIPGVEDIAFRARMDKPSVINGLQELKEFLTDVDINAISTRYQTDAPETEGEGEEKAETEGIGIPIPSLPGLPAVEGTQGKADVSKKPRIQKTEDPLRWVGGDKMWDGIKGSDYEKWQSAYPAVELDTELVKMDQWLQSNPTKAKKKQWRKFVTGWFNRAQEKGGR
jgi:hypothetical protein